MPSTSLRSPLSSQELTAKEHALALLTVDEWPELEQVKALHRALKKADEDFVASFRENGGMVGIGKVGRLTTNEASFLLTTALKNSGLFSSLVYPSLRVPADHQNLPNRTLHKYESLREYCLHRKYFYASRLRTQLTTVSNVHQREARARATFT